MLTNESIKTISKIFCGDDEDLYSYKKGSQLVEFFNRYFSYNDSYENGFPSRWAYVHDRVIELINKNKIDRFFTLILSKEYLISDLKCSELEALTKISRINERFNKILEMDLCTLRKKGSEYILIKDNDDFVYIDSGGFADVYKQKSTGYIVKKLKDEMMLDSTIRSRFKREFAITKKLNRNPGIIKVYDFDTEKCSYTMEEGEQTLEKYVNHEKLDEETKIKCIRIILAIMKDVHNEDVVHRDISPNNIFICYGMIKIADFGLGKALNMMHSHHTLKTKEVGQYYYCAPEQLRNLKDGDKRSDVFSLGRLMNFIMNSDPMTNNHMFKSVTDKATSENPALRPSDAGDLLDYIEKSIIYHTNEVNEQRIKFKITHMQLDEEVVSYISELSGENICEKLVEGLLNFSQILLKYMESSEKYATEIIESVFNDFGNVCKTFADNDPIALFASNVICAPGLRFPVKEMASRILSYVARDVHRFYAQSLVEDCIKKGMDPLLEEVLVN
jgi:tRNA A-37 threonylcarbamoyl transferase component Bud32